jgi:hypothetical protein
VDKGVDGSLFSYKNQYHLKNELIPLWNFFVVTSVTEIAEDQNLCIVLERTFMLSELIVGCGDDARTISDFE